MKNNILEDDGERMVPEFHKGTVLYAEHMTRYLAAKQLVKGLTVLDIASGSGYGTKILSSSAKTVYGVDVDEGAIKYANSNYSAKNIVYKLGDGINIPLDDNSVDVVITFETIEHIENYSHFVKEVKRVLKPNGIAVVSTPNELEFTEGNHFHLHEFEHDELKNLLHKDFTNIDAYYQATWVYAGIASADLIANESEATILTYNFMPLTPDKYLYFYFVCSNKKITHKIEPIGALGGHYSAKELVEIQDLNTQNIKDYKTVLKNANEKNIKIQEELDRVNSELSIVEASLDKLQKTKISRIKRKILKTKKIFKL